MKPYRDGSIIIGDEQDTQETARHTPGPWILYDKSFSGAYQITGPQAGALRICTTTNGPREKANARLIAAAPDLLEALKFLVDAAETEPGMQIYSAHIGKARQAIARAEGHDA